MLYSISYDLKKPGQNYSDLIKKIKSYGTYAHVCESYWLIETSSDANQIFASLKPYLDANDWMVVSRFDKSDCAGWVSQEISTWIAARNQSPAYSYR